MALMPSMASASSTSAERDRESWVWLHGRVKPLLNTFTLNGAGGGNRNIKRIENAQVIDFVRRTKLKKRRNCAQLERIWNAGFSSFHPSRKKCVANFAIDCRACHSTRRRGREGRRLVRGHRLIGQLRGDCGACYSKARR
jgi:hypothetical protein